MPDAYMYTIHQLLLALQGIFRVLPLFFIVVCVVIVAFYSRCSRTSHPDIPAVGCSGNITFYAGSLRFLFDAPRVLAAGYAKHRYRLFKVAINHDWHVFVSGSAYLKDLLDAPEDVLSADAANNDRFQVPHTIGNGLWDNAPMIRGLIGQLARDFDVFVPSMMDEISFVFDRELPMNPASEWKPLGTLNFCSKLIRQANTRVFIGIEKARDSKYLDFIMNFPRKVMFASMVLNWLPNFLKPLFAKLFSVSSDFRQGSKYLEPLIEAMRDGTDFTGSDCEYSTLSRVIEQGRRHNTDLETLVIRFMMINFGAMHSSTYTLTHALHHLVTMPNTIEMLRQEAQESIDELGWTKAGLANMVKLDSFIRESQRVSAINAVGTQLKAKRSFTFSDGTRIPAGTTLSIPLDAAHADDLVFQNAKQFDPLRFYNPDPELQTQYTALGLDYLAWGFGKHACPGRFYASNLLKSVLAYLLIHCDLRLHGGKTKRPADIWVESNRLPHPSAKIELRRRRSKV